MVKFTDHLSEVLDPNKIRIGSLVNTGTVV